MKVFLQPKVLTILIALFSTFVVLISLRGNLGTPNPTTLNSSYWKEDGPFELSPERGRYALTYSLIENKSPHFSVDLARFVTPDLGYKNGNYVSLFAPSISYIASIGYTIGRYFNAAQIGSFAIIAIFSILNLLLIYLITRELNLNHISCLIGGLIFLFASPAFAYATSLYQHHVSTFSILLTLYLTIRWNTWLSLSIVWLLCAFSITIDYPNIFLMLPLGFYNLGKIIKINFASNLKVKINFLRILTFLSITIPISFFLWFNYISYGSPLQFSGTVSSVVDIDQGGDPIFSHSDKNNEINSDDTSVSKKSAISFFKARYLIEDLYIHIISPDRGIMYFTPVIILGIIGVFFLYKKYSKITVVLVAIIIMNLLLYSMWGDPWGGWAFGSRYLIPSYSILSIFLAAFLDHYRKNIYVMLIFLPLASYSLYVNTAGALSSSANPPQVQVLSLEKISGRVEKYSYDRNIDFLKYNTSKSFVFRTWAKKYVSSWQYFQIISASLIAATTLCTLALYFSKDKGES